MGLILNTVFILYLFNFFKSGDVADDFHLQKNYHQPRTFSNDEVAQVARLSDMARFEKILSNILVPRVVGSESHKKVREYIINELRGLHWTVETQESLQQTPLFGKLTFTNVIARLNPSADRYLVLACHYDSKHMREGAFMGATDSAVPCAMMIDLAYALQQRLQPFKESNLSLMLLFFDGEEAFVSWGPNDSLYGSRNLAQIWDQRNYPYPNSQTDELNRIDLLVLLDLLGTPQPTFYSYFRKTQRWYLRLAEVERKLTDLQLLKKNNYEVYFNKQHLGANIDDDHVPFLRRDVPCLHVIPTPFPDVWHELGDNYNALDMSTIDNLNKIFRVFTLEYLQGSGKRPRSDLLVLLDLLGAPQPSFVSHFENTHKWYQQMVSAEQRLFSLGLLKNPVRPYFINLQLNLGVEDDHIPFIERDVPCLHIIPSPFPDVWHKLEDNYSVLDFDVIKNLLNILYVFTLEYVEGIFSSPHFTVEEL